MPYRTWLLFAAFGGLTAFVLAAVFASFYPTMLPEGVYEQCQYQGQAANQYSHIGHCAAALAIFSAVWIVDAIAAYSGVITALATLTIAIFTYTLWKANGRLWESSKRNADIAERAVDEQQSLGKKQVKAYLSIKSVEFILDLSRDKPSGTFFVTIENSGQSPAFDVAIAINVHDVHSGPEYSELRIGAIPSKHAVTEDDGITFEPKEVLFSEGDPNEMIVGADVTVTARDVFDDPITVKEGFSAWLPYTHGSRYKMHRAREKFSHIIINFDDEE